MATHVHDMHLADGPQHSGEAAAGAGRGAAAAPAAGAAAAGQQQAAQTYAQATGRAGAGGAAGAAGAAGSGAGGAAQAQPHLAFYMGGRLLQPGTTIFQAVQQQLAAEAAGGGGTGGASGSAVQPGAQPGGGASGGDLGSRLWGQVHTITYRTWGAAMRLQEAEAATSVMSPRAAAGAAGGLGGSGGEAELESGPHDHDDAAASPLAELLASALPADIQASQVGLGLRRRLRGWAGLCLGQGPWGAAACGAAGRQEVAGIGGCACCCLFPGSPSACHPAAPLPAFI